MRIVFAVDFRLFAAELEVGYFIKYIWVEIIWKQIRICVDLWLVSFCI